MSPRVRGSARGALPAASLAAAVLLFGARLPGAVEAAAFLAPAFMLLVLLARGRYPGERALLAVARRAHARVPLEPMPAPTRVAASIPRGGGLLASALAGRAPPPLSRPL